jgi:hypothetical protein
MRPIVTFVLFVPSCESNQANFSSLIASEFTTCPPTRLVA